MNDTKTFHIITLGCRTNQYESQSLRESWLARGFSETQDAAHADIILVNSCAVTAKAVRDTNQAAHKALRQAPDAKLIIAGCAAQVLGDKLRTSNPTAEIVPQSRKHALAKWPDQSDEEPGFPGFQISSFFRSRAVVKVQDGCSHGCSFCIVPKTRGRSISREPEQVVAEVARLFEAGFAEVSLSGVNLRHYGRDLSRTMDFWDLVKRIDAELSPEWAGRARIRLSSLDPGQLGPKALDTLGGCKLACPHLHLSLQSLSPKVLAAMNRGHYGPEGVSAFVGELEGVWPIFGLGADLLTGFPGETGEDFEQTLAACDALPLTYAHVFPYSRRPGTPAAHMPGQVPKELAKSRALALRDMAAAKKSAFMERLLDMERLNVILESPAPAKGVCEYYARVAVEPQPGTPQRGTLCAVRPRAARPEMLIAAPA